MASEGAPSEPLKYKTWVLKVSIHCEGCKKKVKRVLQSIEGVYTTEVDALQNKVTVTGDVDAQTLIGKLAKSKKHAELWPEKKPNNNNSKNQKPSKDSSKSKDPGESSDNTPSASPAGDTSAAAAAAKHFSGENKSVGKVTGGNEAEETASDKPAEPPKNASKVLPVSEEKNAAAESSNSPPDKAAGPATDGGKKKGKKGEKENSNGNGEGETVAKEAGGGSNSEAGSISRTPPQLPPQQMYHYPVYPPQPAYVMSYNTAHPSTSQAYYATPMPPVPQSYTYSPYPPPPEFYYDQSEPSSSMSLSQPPPPPPPGSYDDVFSDENPNSCNLM